MIENKLRDIAESLGDLQSALEEVYDEVTGGDSESIFAIELQVVIGRLRDVAETLEDLYE